MSENRSSGAGGRPDTELRQKTLTFYCHGHPYPTADPARSDDALACSAGDGLADDVLFGFAGHRTSRAAKDVFYRVESLKTQENIKNNIN
ncbi:hypothetical protein [Nguyenibacter sp. L1]|uniref:hypothetical protein n=1 Tax=Nguyenibacter sp. L1 TaxID=3049350 RepID=UPI002B4AA8B7|nr:hypothetical protein [Nguyenibacter sp. L1]WRH89427.1 hypothetical protein QN315_07510 [Nguyenibacter sp. L1]